MSNTAAVKSDMCHGPLAKKMILFTLPLIASSMLQLLFNAADVIVVGRFAGSESLAAVGSTGPLVNLIVNLFIGLSIGANVTVAQAIGAGKAENVRDTVHTSMLLSIISGIILTLVGIPLSHGILQLMGSPENVIDLSALYLKIYFMGMPALMVYNFGNAILNASGDTKRPLYFLSVAGVINVVLNLFFVIVCGWGVAGVAVATIISQYVSAVAIVVCLMRNKGDLKLEIKKLRIKKDRFFKILKIGIPAGIQGMVFSLSNIVLQSAINSFGSVVMAGSAAAGNIEGFIYVAMNAYNRTSLTYIGQNYGAHEYKRVKRIFLLCSVFVIVTGFVLGMTALFFGNQLLGIYSTDPQVIQEGMVRMSYVCSMYFLCGLMDVAAGSLRGMGFSVAPMIVSLIGACGLRILWVFTVFKKIATTGVLFMCYPITWGVTAATLAVIFIVMLRRVQNKMS